MVIGTLDSSGGVHSIELTGPGEQTLVSGRESTATSHGGADNQPIRCIAVEMGKSRSAQADVAVNGNFDDSVP